MRYWQFHVLVVDEGLGATALKLQLDEVEEVPGSGRVFHEFNVILELVGQLRLESVASRQPPDEDEQCDLANDGHDGQKGVLFRVVWGGRS